MEERADRGLAYEPFKHASEQTLSQHIAKGVRDAQVHGKRQRIEGTAKSPWLACGQESTLAAFVESKGLAYRAEFADSIVRHGRMLAFEILEILNGVAGAFVVYDLGAEEAEGLSHDAAVEIFGLR